MKSAFGIGVRHISYDISGEWYKHKDGVQYMTELLKHD